MEQAASYGTKELECTVNAKLLGDAQTAAKKDGLSFDTFVQNSLSIYSANIVFRFMRGFVIFMCVANAIAAIPAGMQMMFWHNFSGASIGVGIAIMILTGIPGAIAIPPLLKRVPKGYLLGLVAMGIWFVWTFVEVNVLGYTPNGWNEFLATGAASKNLMYSIVGTISAIVLWIATNKADGKVVA